MVAESNEKITEKNATVTESDAMVAESNEKITEKNATVTEWNEKKSEKPLILQQKYFRRLSFRR